MIDAVAGYPSLPSVPGFQDDSISQWVVVCPAGVAWRRSANFADRTDGHGPGKGSKVSGRVVAGHGGLKFLKVSDGAFLPIVKPEGDTLLQMAQPPLPPIPQPSNPPPQDSHLQYPA